MGCPGPPLGHACTRRRERSGCRLIVAALVGCDLVMAAVVPGGLRLASRVPPYSWLGDGAALPVGASLPSALGRWWRSGLLGRVSRRIGAWTTRCGAQR